MFNGNFTTNSLKKGGLNVPFRLKGRVIDKTSLFRIFIPNPTETPLPPSLCIVCSKPCLVYPVIFPATVLDPAFSDLPEVGKTPLNALPPLLTNLNFPPPTVPKAAAPIYMSYTHRIRQNQHLLLVLPAKKVCLLPLFNTVRDRP